MPVSATRKTGPAPLHLGATEHRIMGTSELVRMAYEGRDLDPVFSALSLRAARDPFDAAALFDLSVLLQATGQREKALSLQDLALAASRQFTRIHGDGSGLRVLVIATRGDLMANTPIDFLLEQSNATQHIVFVDETTETLGNVPPHDVAFFAIGESPENTNILCRIEPLLRKWQGPIMNNMPHRIAALTRDGVAALFKDASFVVAPFTVRVSRISAEDLASGRLTPASLIEGVDYPLIIRPVGTHAGTGLEKLTSSEALIDYLEREPAKDFYIAPYIDYASRDGLFRKQRIAFIDGVPYASHLAVSENWIVHYLSAGMAEHSERRNEEARWMADFSSTISTRMREAFNEIQGRIGLDYFAIDCAELPDGRLLLFEADVAMIVHALDCDDLFPYKKPAMDRLFEAFMSALEKRSRNRPTHA